MAPKKASVAPLALVLIMTALVGRSCEQLASGFYDGLCGDTSVEELIFNITQSMMQAPNPGPGLVGDLTRLSFHDCFVRGCDASVMLDGDTSEKTAPENSFLDGFDDIETIKQQIEAICPGVVSCADILVMATRDTLNIAGANRYEVLTGRRDGFISNAEDAVNVPGPNTLISEAIGNFSNIGLDVNDLVVLLGSHTVGVVHCSNFQDRLYNFSGTGQADPTMDPALVETLKIQCPSNEDGTVNTTFLDQTPNSGDTFDLGYYNQIIASRGVIKFDERLATDSATKDLVETLAHGSGSCFSDEFGKAMIKMTSIGVLTGTDGEIRKTCNAVNGVSAM